MQERAEGLQKVAATGDAQQLPPGTAIGMAIRAEVAPSHPSPIGTVRIRAKVRRGVDLAAAPSRRHEAWWRSCGGLRAGSGGVLTGVAVRLAGEARKGCGRTVALGPWAWGLRCRRTHSGGGAGARPPEHDAQPHHGGPHPPGKKKKGEQGKNPPSKGRKEGIFSAFHAAGNNRREQVKKQQAGSHK